ncbi:response regulator transcription factor [Streptococcus infantis]|uniref:response regulator transcription factor n=1 Tax=Streptococcus infantis TaxID=68892 RepID=UPI0039C49FAA
MAYKILVVDDDLDILRIIKKVLEYEKYEVVIRNNIEEIDLCDFTGFDLILLDIMMPVSGLEVCQMIREQISVPICFITAKDMDEDLVAGINVGADDYIMKPFSMPELLARVKMHLRREERTKGTVHQIKSGKLVLYTDSKELFIKNNKVPLTSREFDIVSLLASHPNKIYSIEEIYNYLYPQSSEALLRSVSEYIYQIRQKLKPYQLNPIKTLYGGGYQWVESKVLDN